MAILYCQMIKNIVFKIGKNKKRRTVSPSVQFTSGDKTSTSKTLRSLNSSNSSIFNHDINVNKTATESLKLTGWIEGGNS